RAFRLRLFDHPFRHLRPAVRERLRHPLQLSAEDRLQPGTELGADVARAHGEAEDLAEHFFDRVSRDVVHGRDEHSSMTSVSDVTRSPVHSRTSAHAGSRPSGAKSTGVIPTRAAPPSSSFAPSPTKSAPAGSTSSAASVVR